MQDWIAALKEKQFGRGRYSQSYQDVLIDEIFDRIGTANSPPFCVEFGFDTQSLVGSTGPNVANLVLNRKWDHLLLDGDNENADINLRKHFLTSDNICDIFRTYNVPKEPEYVSIDVDSTDLWIFQALLKEYRARLFSVEYNANFPLDASITFPNDIERRRFAGDRSYGASLRALTNLANSQGYSLLWVVPSLDAFFVRNDLIDDGSGELVFPFSTWRHLVNRAMHAPIKDDQKLHTFVDFDEFTASRGERRSTLDTYATCKAFLTDPMDVRSIRRRGFGRLRKDIRALFAKL